MIPKIIHQCYVLESPDSLPSLWKEYANEINKLHPDWEYIFWDNKSIKEFIKTHYPKWLWVLDESILAPCKVDITRYLISYHYGGWYIDFDCKGFKPLDKFLVHDIVLPLESDIAYKDEKNQIGNAVYGNSKKHFYMSKVLDGIIKNKDIIQSLKSIDKERAIELTGPVFFHKIYENLSSEKQKLCFLAPRENFHVPPPHPPSPSFFKKVRKNPNVYILHLSHSTWRQSIQDRNQYMRIRKNVQNQFVFTLSMMKKYVLSYFSRLGIIFRKKQQ